MGLCGEDVRFRAAGAPARPARRAPRARPTSKRRRCAQRLDVQRGEARHRGRSPSRSGLTKATRFINVLELGPARTKEDPEPWKRGYELELEIPLFDWGGARVAQAEALYMQVGEPRRGDGGQRALRGARGLRGVSHRVRHWRATTATRSCRCARSISEEKLLRYNGMLISVFELLADAREQVASVNAAIEALRDFWIAEADLQAALERRRRSAPAATRARCADARVRRARRTLTDTETVTAR